MNKDLIYLKNSKDSYMKVLFLTLIMTSTFGFYKNIICLLNENVNEKIIIKAILFPLLGFVLGFVFDYLKNKSLKIDYNSLTGFLVGMHASINLNVLVFILSFFVLFMLNKLDKNNYFNKPAILMLLLALIMVFSGSYDYQNILEKKYLYDYSYLDKLIGRQVGGLFNTSVLLMIISYIILSFNKLYKKDIFIVSYFTYLIVLLIIFIITKNYKWDLLINSNTIFYLVFIASLNIYSPYHNKERIIYSILIGAITGVIMGFTSFTDAAAISIIILNILFLLKDTLFDKINNPNVI